MQNYGRLRIVGSSFFIVCARDYFDEAAKYDETIEIASVHLIDMCHMEKYSNPSQRDQGFLKGTKGIINILKEIIDENDEQLNEVNK